MAKEWAKKFYASKAWGRCRAGYIQHVNGLCERCYKQGLHVVGYIVHHKVMLTPSNINNPDITLNWGNLEYLCIDCHNNEHMSKYSNTANGLIFDSNGDLINVQ